MQVSSIFHIYPMGELAIHGNPLLFSVGSVSSVASSFFQDKGKRA